MRVLHTHLVCDFFYRTFSCLQKSTQRIVANPSQAVRFQPILILFTLFLVDLPNLSAQIGCDNAVNGGTIEANEFGCPNPTWDPSPITNVTLPSGGTGTLEYIWIMTTDDPGTPLSQWTPIPNSNGPNYDPAPISVTTHYRRCARRSGCIDYIAESNIITKEAICCDNVTDGGDIAADQMFCTIPADPAPIANVNLPTGGTNTLEYQWVVSTTGTPYSPSNPDWTTIPNANGVSYDPASISQTTYFIRLSRRHGCIDYEGVSNMVTITIGNQLIVSLIGNNETCPGNNDGWAAVANLQGGIPPYTYVWDDAAAQTADTAFNLAPGIYTVVVTDQAGCTGSASITVENAESMVLNITHTDASCGASNDGSATVNVVGGAAPYTFLWSDPLAQTTQTAQNLSPASYSVIVTDANGCTASGSEVVEAPMPVVVITTSTDVSCFGGSDGSAIATIQNGDTTFYDFLWDDAASTSNAAVTGLAPGNYAVIVSDTNGCVVTSEVTINQPDILVLTMDADSATCADESDGFAIVYVTGGTPFPNNDYEYSWDAPGNPTVQMLDDVSPGIYTVTVTDANGCTAWNSVEVGAPTKVTPQITTTDVLCAGDANGAASVAVTGGNPPYTYAWGDPAASTTSSIANLAPGNYGLTVTDATGCTGTGIATIAEPPALTLTINKQDVICEDDNNGTATAIPAGGTPPYTFIWNNGQSSASIGGLGIGSYSVTVTDGNGCEIAGTTVITFTSSLSSSVTSTEASCFDSNDGTASATGVAGSAPYTYLWSNGETTATIDSLFAGTYQVTISDSDGCQVFNEVTVSAPPQLLCQAFVTAPVTTYQGSDGAAVAGAAGGVGPYSFHWSNGMVGDSITNLSPGTHTVTVTDANGCFCITQITLISPSKIGNFVWDDTNQNGIQDAGEPGVEGVTVWLTGTTNAGQVPVNMTTVTDSLGHYDFDGLVPGFYRLKIAPLANQVFTHANIGNDALDSDFSPVDSSTQSFPLPQGFYDSKWDAGLVVLDEKVNIGDMVWLDQNHDGIQDPTESGIGGVNVKLISMPSNTLVAVTTTNLLGKYLFTDVMPGNYLVEFNPISLPNGYVFSPQDQGGDDTKDSDPFVNTGRTAQFQVLPFTFDILTIDAGAFKECDNVTDGGLVGYDEDLCGTGADPAEIVNILLPTGGFGNLEYLWLTSLIPVYNGPGDPNWVPIPNSNTPNYDPGPIGQTTYYIRCARRQGCVDYPAESNIVAKKITAFPLTQIIDEPYELCKLEGGRFEAAIAGGGATYFWQFGSDAEPETATTRVVNGVYWENPGTKTVTLTVTRFGCSYSVTTTVEIDPCGLNPLIGIENLGATLVGDAVQLNWQTIGDLSNSLMYIQCSEDGQLFKTISILGAVGSAEGGTYSYLDTKPHLGDNIYRIKFEKLAGENVEGYSNTVSIYFKPLWVGRVQVYPNPSSGEITVELLHPDVHPAVVEVTSAFGKTLKTFELPANADKLAIDLQGYPEGLYMVVVTQKGYQPQISKVMKTH